MITVELARQLASDGVLWQPKPGDRFIIDEHDLAGELFWISDLTIELHHYQDQSVLGFNGTTEWALDSVPLDIALWLPREDQLRALLGLRFEALRRGATEWVVSVRDGAGVSEFARPRRRMRLCAGPPEPDLSRQAPVPVAGRPQCGDAMASRWWTRVICRSHSPTARVITPTTQAVTAMPRVSLNPITQGEMMNSAPSRAVPPSADITSGRTSSTIARAAVSRPSTIMVVVARLVVFVQMGDSTA